MKEQEYKSLNEKQTKLLKNMLSDEKAVKYIRMCRDTERKYTLRSEIWTCADPESFIRNVLSAKTYNSFTSNFLNKYREYYLLYKKSLIKK